MAAAHAGAIVAWVVPTYRNARPLWRFVEAHANGKGLHRSEMTADIGRGRLGVYTADNDTALRGEAFDLAIVDEAAQIRGETWSDVLMPTLADRDGRAMLISTPKGRNWFWQEYQRGLADGQRQASFTAPSSANPMPTIQAAAKLAKERVSARTYRQEWLAEFVDDGSFFTGVRQAVRPAIGFDERHSYVIGVDWARSSSGDASVFVVLDATAQQMVDLVRLVGVPYDQQLARLRDLWRNWGQPYILAEYNSMGGPLVEQLQLADLPVEGFTTTAASKHDVMTGLQLALEKGELGLLDDPTLLAELEAFEVKARTGLPAYGAPAGMHDDTVMALALAAYAARGTGPGYMDFGA